MSAELIAVALLGLIVGSFLNAFLYRYNTGVSIARGRSKCMHCAQTLGVSDLVPVFSYIFLQGKCRYCRSKISVQYPLVELAAAALAIGVYMRTPDLVNFLLGFGIWMTLLFVVVYDFRHKIIPWGASGLVAALALLALLFSGPTLLGLLAGPLLASPLLFFSLVSGGRWMGWGDGALQLGLGWMLGLTAGLTGFVLAFWTGAVVGIGLLIFARAYTMKSEMPFAPFLVLGAAITYFLHVDLFQTLPLLFTVL